MGFNPFNKKSWEKVGNDINHTVIQPVADVSNQVVNTVVETAVDTSHTVAHVAVNTATTIAKETSTK